LAIHHCFVCTLYFSINLLSRNLANNTKSKFFDRSYVHCPIIPDSQLRSSSHTNSLVKKYNNLCDGSGELVSELAIFLNDAISQPVNIRRFYVDRILDHRNLDFPESLTNEMINHSSYTPGIPTDAFPPITFLFEHACPFLQSSELQCVMLNETGIFYLSESSKIFQNPAQNKPKKPPEKVEFLIKWQDSSEEFATWENAERLLKSNENEIFSIANPMEFFKLRDIYWNHVDPTFIVQPISSKLEILMPEQKRLVNRLREHQKKIALIGEPGCGRVMSVCAFLEHFSTVKCLVLVDRESIPIWVKAIRELTSLIWIEYSGESQNRIIIRSHEFRTNSRFNVLITTAEIFIEDIKFLRFFEWNIMVIDLLRRSLNFAIVELSKTTIFLSCQELSGIESIKLSPLIHQHQEILLFVRNFGAHLIQMRLRSLIKTRSNRVEHLRSSPQYFQEILKTHIHPCLFPMHLRQLVLETYPRSQQLDHSMQIKNFLFQSSLSNNKNNISISFKMVHQRHQQFCLVVIATNQERKTEF